jgi:hypothetical protein
MTAVRTDLMIWPQLLPFRQPMFARSKSRDFVVPFLVSVVIHAFLVFLLGVVDTDRTAFEPTAPSIDTHMIVSLTTFDTASQNELDREAVSVVPNTGPPAQRSQFSPERSRSAERKAEAESIVESIDLGIPGLEVPDDKSLATHEIPSIDLEAISRIDLELGGTSELEFKTVVTSIDLGLPDLEVPDGNSLATDEIPSIDLEAIPRIDLEFGGTSELEFKTVVTSIDLGLPDLEVPDGNSLATDEIPLIDPEAISRTDLEGTLMHRIALEGTWMHCIERESSWAACIDREGTLMSKSEVLMQNYAHSMLIIKRNRALLPPDCRIAYANMGQLGIFFIIRDAITGDGCKW